uniref:C-type lectin domain-containing protein n=1 Tax=Poecilia latipinna TaxID=48699 RepID=A0A3B3TKI6_9TELE
MLCVCIWKCLGAKTKKLKCAKGGELRPDSSAPQGSGGQMDAEGESRSETPVKGGSKRQSTKTPQPSYKAQGSHANPEFVFGKEPLSWSDAQTYCRKNFIDLAIFKNDTDYQKIQVSTLGGYRHWIGLFRDPNLHWSDGSGVNFTSWDSAPTMIGSMPVICGVTSSGKSGRWKFLPCETRLPFVCVSFLFNIFN